MDWNILCTLLMALCFSLTSGTNTSRSARQIIPHNHFKLGKKISFFGDARIFPKTNHFSSSPAFPFGSHTGFTPHSPTVFPAHSPTVFTPHSPTVFPTHNPTVFPSNSHTVFSSQSPTVFPSHTPTVFPPHSPIAHFSAYPTHSSNKLHPTSPSIPSNKLHPTSPSLHFKNGYSDFFTVKKSPKQATITHLHPIHMNDIHQFLDDSSDSYDSDEIDTKRRPGGGYHPSKPQHGKKCRKHHGRCEALAACAPYFDDVKEKGGSLCEIYRNAPGICCPLDRSVSGKMPEQKVFTPVEIFVKMPRFSVYQLNEAAKHGLWEINERDQLEQNLISRNIVVSNRKSPEYKHLQFFKTSPRAMKIGRSALTVERSSNFIMKRYALSKTQAGFGLRQFSVRDTILGDSCPTAPSCGEKEEYYRTIDGSCNNLRNPMWGQARTLLERILPPQYEDGVYEPRGGNLPSRLPSARTVSVSNVADVDNPATDLTLAVMQWGQFIDHDLTHVPIFRFGNESGIECCDDQGNFVNPAQRHPSCFEITIPADDPFFSEFGRRCMNFVRSMPAQSSGCSFGLAEQMNQITHYLDGSNVYGSSSEEEEAIRANQGGLLNVQGRALLPADPNASEDSCDATDRGFQCFLAGDNRVNEQPDLTVIHTIWMREHNRLALKLTKLNPHWDDETLFQESRRIAVAQMQHIVYNEWLPIILGWRGMSVNGILPQRRGYSFDYDINLNAAIRNEFATVAFRFGHTLVQGMLHLFGKNHRQTDNLELHEHFNSPHLLYTPGKLDEFLRGLSKQPMQAYDNFVTSSLTNRLFQGTEMPFGMDLVALNIQRARDHGIPSYNELRAACGLPRARTFSDLLDVLSEPVVQRMQSLYASVDDIDAFVAGISERPSRGALVGPTFGCIIMDAFIRLRKGDRFYYENGGMISSFTEPQLQEIRKTSWARIMCDNGDHIKNVQPLAMRTISPLNPKVSCSSRAIPKLDLSHWISVPS